MRIGLAQSGGPHQQDRARLDVALQPRLVVDARRLAVQHRQGPFQLVLAAGKQQQVRLVERAPDGAGRAVMLFGPTVQVVGLELRHLVVRRLLGLLPEELLVELGVDDQHAGMLAGLLAVGGQPVQVFADVEADFFAELVQVALGVFIEFEALLPGLIDDGGRPRGVDVDVDEPLGIARDLGEVERFGACRRDPTQAAGQSQSECQQERLFHDSPQGVRERHRKRLPTSYSIDGAPLPAIPPARRGGYGAGEGMESIGRVSPAILAQRRRAAGGGRVFCSNFAAALMKGRWPRSQIIGRVLSQVRRDLYAASFHPGPSANSCCFPPRPRRPRD